MSEKKVSIRQHFCINHHEEKYRPDFLQNSNFKEFISHKKLTH